MHGFKQLFTLASGIETFHKFIKCALALISFSKQESTVCGIKQTKKAQTTTRKVFEMRCICWFVLILIAWRLLAIASFWSLQNMTIWQMIIINIGSQIPRKTLGKLKWSQSIDLFEVHRSKCTVVFCTYINSLMKAISRAWGNWDKSDAMMMNVAKRTTKRVFIRNLNGQKIALNEEKGNIYFWRQIIVLLH